MESGETSSLDVSRVPPKLLNLANLLLPPAGHCLEQSLLPPSLVSPAHHVLQNRQTIFRIILGRFQEVLSLLPSYTLKNKHTASSDILATQILISIVAGNELKSSLSVK